MQVPDFKRFIFENKIKQSFLAQYLGVSEGYISSVVSGRKELSEENFSKVLNNPYGWNTSMLTPKSKYIVAEGLLEGVGLAREKSAEELLVSYLQDKIADQDRVIRELYKEIGMLQAKLDLARKGETAPGATGSSDADAV